MSDITAENIRILIVDDHAVVREGQRALIETEPGMLLVGEGVDGIEAIELTDTLNPDVLLIDLLMPRMDGVESIGKIRAQNSTVKILVLTSYTADDKVFSAIKAGAQGYLLKDATPEELLDAIRKVYRGEPTINPEIAQKLVSELQHSSEISRTEEALTEREVEVLVLVAQGLSNLNISERIFISERTVRTHVSHILDKLHLANRTQATLYALRNGLADLNP
jgi:NarL family two-component system response regulator LiaR